MEVEIWRFLSVPPTELENLPIEAPGQISSNLLTQPPAPSQEQKENKNSDYIKIKLLQPLDAYQISKESQIYHWSHHK